MTTPIVRAARVLTLIVVVLGISCCGGGAAQSNVSSGDPGESHGRMDRASAMGEQSARSLPAKGGCGAASARVGRSPGVIEFKLKCKPYGKRRTVDFDLGLAPIPDHATERIRSFRRYPEVKEAGSSPRRGVCDWYGGGLSCSTHLRSLVHISGRLWVKKGAECDSLVVITESKPIVPCSGPCSGDARLIVVAEARPRGC